MSILQLNMLSLRSLCEFALGHSAGQCKVGFESRLYVLEPVTVQVFLLIGKIYFMVVVVVV